MKDYTNKIEKYLRGQMSHEEETVFKKEISSDSLCHTFALLTTQLLKTFQKRTRNS